MRLRFVDYTLKLLRLSQVMRKWHDLLGLLDGAQRERIARFAEQIAGTLGRRQRRSSVSSASRVSGRPSAWRCVNSGGCRAMWRTS
jgi:hypothetical protein